MLFTVDVVNGDEHRKPPSSCEVALFVFVNLHIAFFSAVKHLQLDCMKVIYK